jgi:glycosyltransferase involved in cell wall biosynthesis
MSGLRTQSAADRWGPTRVAREKREVDLVVLVNGFPRLSETFVLQELLDLERRGLRLRLVALSDPGESVRQDELRRLQATVEYLPMAGLTSRRRKARAHATLLESRRGGYLASRLALRGAPEYTPGLVVRAALLASRLVRLGSPPLYIQFAHKPATIGRFAARLAGVPYAMSCHAKDIWLTPQPELEAKVRGAELALTCTAVGWARLEYAAAGATPVVLVHHGVDVEVDTARHSAAGPPRILTVGRLVAKKGHDTLIRAASMLRDRGIDFTVRIAGEGVEWGRLQRMVHELGLAGHVEFLGPLSPLEVHAEYMAASVFALACRQLPNGDRDGLPNVLLEAMARELPAVSTRVEGVSEAIEHGRSGLLTEPDDPSAFAAALERVLSHPELARRLGTGARTAVVERFDRRRLLPAVAGALAEAGLVSANAAVAHPDQPATPVREAA